MAVSLFVCTLLLLFCAQRYEASPASDLHAAVAADDEESLKRLIDQGHDINSVGEGGQTALMRACLSGKVINLDTPSLSLADVVLCYMKVAALKYLLEAGADVTIGEKDGYICPHGIAYQGRAEAVPALTQFGGLDIWMKKHEDGYYPIHRACWGEGQGHTVTVRKMLRLGVPYDLKADNGSTPLENVRGNEATRGLLKAWAAKKIEEEKKKDEV